MKKIKENYVFIIVSISLISVIIVAILQLITKELFIGIIGSIATLYFGYLKYKIENDKVFIELFKTFNERYNSKINDLINELRRKERDILTTDEEVLIIDYFNLCSEEYMWKTKNRIPERVWEAWKAGMLENLEIPLIKELFENEVKSKNGRLSYYGLAEELGF